MKKAFIITFIVIIVLNIITGCSNSTSKNDNDAPPVRNANPATDFEYTIDRADTVGIKRYIGEKTEVIIPERIEGLPVTAILPTAFMNTNAEIFSVVLPKTIISIDARAFGHCSNLTSVILPESIEIIGGSAFEN